jgi:hypothetical protein
MGKRILIFNVIYYAVTLYFIKLGRDDASASLGYGYFIMGFWIVAAVVLVLLLITKLIRPKSILEKIGIFTATPVLMLTAIWLMVSFRNM